MTRNPTEYTKNACRNRLRAIEQERRKIQGVAVQTVQRLAAVYDPSGEMFNVKPVTTLEDGPVVTLEAVERRKEKEAERAEAASNKACHTRRYRSSHRRRAELARTVRS